MKQKFNMDAITLANSYPPLLLNDYKRLEETVSREFRWYLIGLTCSLANQKSFQSDELNNQLTRVQIAQNSGYVKDTLKQFIRYTNAIAYIQKIFPDIATDILSGRTKLGLKTTILLSKQPPDNIPAIMKRIEAEDTPIRMIITEQIKNSVACPNDNSNKDSPKSIKDIPCYDPDAQVTGLTYTIPSWVKAIDRVHISENLNQVSRPARNKLSKELINLKSVANALIELIAEVQK